LTIQQLRYFLAAIEHGSFSAAADVLHLAQPSLSEQIRRLEGELGVALFVRAGRRLVLTEAGRALRPEAERTLASAERAAASVAEVRELTGGTASFGTFGDAPSRFLGNIVATFRRRHPGMRVRLVGINSSEVAEAVRDGSLEAALVVLPIDDAGLEVRPALQDELLYLSAEPSRVRAPAAIEQLEQAPLILCDVRWGSDDPTRRALLERAQRAGVRVEPAIEVENLATALDLAARGFGDTVVARRIMAWRGSVPAALQAVPFAEPIVENFAFIARRDAPLSPATRELIALAEQQLHALAERSGGTIDVS
jgi:DNA-binding transcriptional LysR family regulator